MRPSFSACARVMVLSGDSFLLVVPDLAVVARLEPRPDRQDDAVEDELPERALVLDHARIGQEFLEIAAHGRRHRRRPACRD